ncbi:hypothetical protein MVEN_01105700 [Mycena venus]|uniref:Uncharacterized protein n=1 Tax=Mycena venus TaxID=2733690 RepID=A0A8H6Y4S7_9AGAR|nr:hypothetical protein MVEN_01105700 [Mycena venus]
MQNRISSLRSTLYPHFPPELEREIFQIAALAHQRTIPTLMLVAARVKHWVEPLLYRIIVLCYPTGHAPHYASKVLGLPIFSIQILLRVIATKSPEFLRKSVRHLFLDIPIEPSIQNTIWTVCSGVVNLYIDPPLAVVMGGLQHLRRLTLWVSEFVKCCSVASTRPLLANVTHLALIGGLISAEYTRKLLPCLSLMVGLTHISLGSISGYGSRMHTTLCAKANLQCILFSIPTDDWEDELQTAHPALLDDSRFLCLRGERSCAENWLLGADTGEDYWTLADTFLRARREGKVDRSLIAILNTDTSIWETHLTI